MLGRNEESCLFELEMEPGVSQSWSPLRVPLRVMSGMPP